jgi:hypothetical protein
MITSQLECERKEACPNHGPLLLQPLLGTDKRNPSFSVSRVSRQNSDPPSLHVYYGCELLEVVPDDRQHPAFKLLVGRLSNAGVRLATLCQFFDADPKTIRRWGRALLSDDPHRLFQVLAGREGPRKLTPEVRSFVAVRFPQIYAQSRSGYSQRIRNEIREIFKVSLSGECLRPLFQQLKAEWRQEIDASGPSLAAETPVPTPAPSDVGPAQNRETACVCPPPPPPAPAPADAASTAPLPCEPPAPTPPAIGNQSPCFPPAAPGGTAGFCHHLGVLLFSKVLLDLEHHMAASDSGWLCKQWVATLLLGAVNIEQTKLLDFQGLERLLGRTLRSRFPQRTQLASLAASQSASELLSFNAQLVGAAQARDFYFDPHTKHYTGQQNVLKGWCSNIRWADKVLHSDFFHTAAGEPVYLECADNYQDMRQRFAALLPRFRKAVGLPGQAVITCVIDRAIFSHEVFERVSQATDHHLITWEKNYRPGQWDPKKRSGQCVLERCRNHALDKRVYHFEYLDQLWAKNPKMRQLIVQATNPQGRVVEVSVLTDDLKRAAAEIVLLMFQRWVQENDFKYLEQHFGINQITSYASVAYERLKEQVQTRQIKSGAYKALERQAAQIKSQLSKQLLAEHQHPGPSAQRTGRIAALDQELKEVREKQAQTDKEVSRLDELIEQQAVRLDTRNKRLMDSFKMTARNAFYRGLEPFKKSYDNFRDDHELFRNLTQAGGVLVERGEEVDAYLLPTVNYPLKLEKIVLGLLAGLNATDLRMPDGTGRRLRLHLGEKAGIEVAIVP